MLTEKDESRDARETQISTQMEELEKNISHLDKIVEELATRLWSALREEEPKIQSPVGQELETLVPLGNSIRVQTERINAITTICKRIIDRLEIA